MSRQRLVEERRQVQKRLQSARQKVSSYFLCPISQKRSGLFTSVSNGISLLKGSGISSSTRSRRSGTSKGWKLLRNQSAAQLVMSPLCGIYWRKDTPRTRQCTSPNATRPNVQTCTRSVGNGALRGRNAKTGMTRPSWSELLVLLRVCNLKSHSS